MKQKTKLDYLYSNFPLIKHFLVFLCIWKYGFCIGLLVFIIYTLIYKKLIKLFFGLKSMTAEERMFLFLEDKYRYNISIVLEFAEKLDVEACKEKFYSLVKLLPKLRYMLNRKFLDYWWNELEYKEAVKYIKFNIEKGFPIKKKLDIQTYLQTKQNELFDLDNEFPYKLTILCHPENNGGDLLVLSFDHIFADGLSSVYLLLGIMDNYSSKQFPLKFTDSIVLKLKAYLFFPFYVLLLFYNNFFTFNSGNTPLKNDTKIKDIIGKSNQAMSKRFAVTEFSQISKEMKISFNDFLLIIFSAALNRYYKKDLGLTEFSNQLSIGVTIATREIPEEIKDLSVGNESTGTLLGIPLVNDPLDLKEVESVTKNTNKYVRNLSYIYSVNILLNYMSTFWNKWLFYKAFTELSNTDFVISNLPGPKNSLFFKGNNITDIIVLSSTGLTQNFFGSVSYNNKIRILCGIDNSTKRKAADIIRNIEEVMMDIYERKYSRLPTIEE